MATFIYPRVQIDTTGLALESTQVLNEAHLGAIETTSASADTKLTTTNSELVLINSELDNQSGLLTTIDADTSSIAVSTVAIAVDTGSIAASATAIEADTGSIAASATAIEADTGAIATSVASIDTKVATEPTVASIDSTLDAMNLKLAGSLVPFAHDYIGLTYVTVGNGIGEISTATYKVGGSGGTTVATLTLAYDVNNKLSSVTKS